MLHHKQKKNLLLSCWDMLRTLEDALESKVANFDSNNFIIPSQNDEIYNIKLVFTKWTVLVLKVRTAPRCSNTKFVRTLFPVTTQKPSRWLSSPYRFPLNIWVALKTSQNEMKKNTAEEILSSKFYYTVYSRSEKRWGTKSNIAHTKHWVHITHKTQITNRYVWV